MGKRGGIDRVEQRLVQRCAGNFLRWLGALLAGGFLPMAA
jgi:hypothetical protein